ncbi:MAG TPA: hypothetical protein IAB06_05080 [Candidatus Avacidaminococcus intestinavium]|uniref:Uncharacterized protein n=1 Tax=Candidatus Avacidaminococcus intestinavium TaxID=2840684 RepID=A0A9D1SL95_9FIRM|nr:hypothetical protein [Candidatus Avacidaminococcus intestinavium]
MENKDLLYLKYPKPHFVEKRKLEADEDEEVIDETVGTSEGILPDGRPYKVEFWQLEDLLLATIYFSATDVSDCTKSELEKYLQKNSLVMTKGDSLRMQCKKCLDDAGCEMWVINIILRQDQQIYASIKGEKN